MNKISDYKIISALNFHAILNRFISNEKQNSYLNSCTFPEKSTAYNISNKKDTFGKFYLFDWFCIGYMALIVNLILLFEKNVLDGFLHVFIHLCIIASIFLLVYLSSKFDKILLLNWIRLLYPLLLYPYGYNELRTLEPLLYGNRWAVDFLIKMDMTVFNILPTVSIQEFYTPALDEIMSFFYASYYLFMPIVIIPLIIKRDFSKIITILSVVTFVYFINYLFFYLFPSFSPRQVQWFSAMHTKDYSGLFFSGLTKYVSANFDIPGGCFPSSHVTGAMAWTYSAWYLNKKLSYLMIPLTIGVIFSTVYLRYHYGVDPLAGIILGIILLFSINYILKKINLSENIH